MIRVQPRGCRQEIRGQVERGGTRPARRVRPQGQAGCAFVDEGPHSPESGRIGGDGWSDSRIAEALGTSVPTVERTRRQLVEEGFEAVLTRRYNPNSAPRRIFDGAAEAKLIALACGPAPAGCAKWTLRLLEEKVVELQIVESASDNTIGRTLKKTFSSVEVSI